MPRPNKRTTQLRKQAVVARSYIHSSNPSEAASSTRASTLAPATPPLSPTPSTLDLNIIPEETDVNPPIEPAEDDSPSTHDQESINNNSPDSDAYRGGKDAKDAQIEVKKFSSRKYSSHRRVTEAWGRRFD